MLTWLRMYQKEVLHSIRTAVAAVGSLLIDAGIVWRPNAGLSADKESACRTHRVDDESSA
jgi:hypothetical protein